MSEVIPPFTPPRPDQDPFLKLGVVAAIQNRDHEGTLRVDHHRDLPKPTGLIAHRHRVNHAPVLRGSVNRKSSLDRLEDNRLPLPWSQDQTVTLPHPLLGMQTGIKGRV